MMAPMRALLISLAATLLTAAPAWAATAGAYAAAEAADAHACASRCADDGLCMMWTFSAAHVCELRASVAANGQAEAAGLSPSAPAFARDIALAPTSQAAAPAPPQRAMALLG